jgi:hypothetical protein
MAELLPYIFNAIVIAGLMYMAWRDGFEQGESTANRKHTKWWSDLRGRCIRIAEQVHGLDNRVDGIEARLNAAETQLKDAELLLKDICRDDATDCEVVKEE